MQSKLFAMGLFSISILLGSCFLDKLTSDEYFLKISIDGKENEWIGAGVMALKLDTLDGIAISAAKTEELTGYKQITITIDGFVGEGDYPINLVTATGVSYLVKTSSDELNALSEEGTVTVTKYKDDIVEGTFNCKLLSTNKKTLEMKSGSFVTKLKTI